MRFLIVPLLALTGPSLVAASPDREAIELIAQDVKPFELKECVPGTIRIESASARELLFNEQGQIFAALGYTTDGRVVAYAHDAFLKSDLLAQPGARTLVLNTIRWAGKSRTPSVGLSERLKPLQDLIEDAGMSVRVLNPEDLVNQVDVYCFVGQETLTKGGMEALRRFAMKGGGVVTAATPWPFTKQYPDFSDFPGNQVANLAGISFQADDTTSVKGAVSVPPAAFDETDPVTAARQLLDPAVRAGKDRDKLIAALKRARGLYGKSLTELATLLPQLNEAVGPIVPTKEKPLKPGDDPLVDAIVSLEDHLNQELPAAQIFAIPAASDYPGAPDAKVPRVTRELTLNGVYKGWLRGHPAGHDSAKEARSTGLYAAPGEVIRVTVPEDLAGKGFEVSIGAYRGNINKREEWHRYPRLQRLFPIGSAVTEAANGFGGIVQILVPPGSQLESFPVKIENAVEAPLYIHGQTQLADWKAQIRNRPAPWAELASDRMILTVPADLVRNLDRPDELMEAWDAIIEKAAELVGVDRKDYRAERLVFDRQTSAGYMHSGYPVAAHFGESVQRALDARFLKTEGDWGFFHEYGHNHQHDLWALPGTTETTCNLWSVYLSEELVGKPRADAHSEMKPLRRVERRNAYFNGGCDFAKEWSVWTALDTYLLVQEKFGWEPFKAVFHEYIELPENEWPKNQQEKNDQFVLRLSRACKTNLAPYFQAWKLPLSPGVEKQLAELPVWEGNPVERYGR